MIMITDRAPTQRTTFTSTIIFPISFLNPAATKACPENFDLNVLTLRKVDIITSRDTYLFEPSNILVCLHVPSQWILSVSMTKRKLAYQAML